LHVAMYGRRPKLRAGRAGTFIATGPQNAYADGASFMKRVPTFYTTVLAYVLVFTVRHVETSAFPCDHIRARKKYDEQLG
jgi:hypothetical protein